MMKADVTTDRLAERFAPLEGKALIFEGERYTLGVGAYPANQHCGERGAIYVLAPDGSMEDKLSVNVVTEELIDGEDFFVPLGEEHARTRQMCEASGLFARTGRVVGSGRVERYAEAWVIR